MKIFLLYHNFDYFSHKLSFLFSTDNIFNLLVLVLYSNVESRQQICKPENLALLNSSDLLKFNFSCVALALPTLLCSFKIG